MKSTLKYLALFLSSAFVVTFSIAVILSLDARNGALVALLFIVVSILLFSISIWGVIKGDLKYLLLRNRFEVIGLLGFSLFLAMCTGLVSFGNAVIEMGVEEQKLDAEEKARYVASTFFAVPSQKDLLTAEKNEVNYFYPEGSEAYIDKFDELIAEEKDRFDRLFGKDKKANLTIEIYDNYETLQIGNPIDNVAGYYSMMNDTLYLYPEEREWQKILLHEYTHYRIDQFMEEQELKMTRIPQWFQEGVSEFMSTTEDYLMSYEHLETVDFRSLDSNYDFHETATAQFDPYVQSYLAVNVLVEENGIEIIPELLSTGSIDSFYLEMDKLTGQNAEEFRKDFLATLIEDRRVVDAFFSEAYAALERKDFETSMELVGKIKKEGKQFDFDEANMLLKDIYLEKGSFEEAIAIIEEQIETGYDYAKVTNLLFLAEIHLLFEPDRSMEYLLQARQDEEAELYRKDRLDQFEEALEMILAGDRKAGYIELIEKNLIMQEKVREEIMQRVVSNN